MAEFLLQQILDIQVAAFQLGIPQRVVVTGPQRVLGYMSKVGVVQLTSYQRPGGGTMTTAQMVKEINEEWEDNVLFTYDDTLIGKGTGGSDLVIITIPELGIQDDSEPNTNEFGANMSPGLMASNTQYVDMPAPREIYSGTSPQGYIHVTAEMRATSGWVFRPELLILASMPYSA